MKYNMNISYNLGVTVKDTKRVSIISASILEDIQVREYTQNTFDRLPLFTISTGYSHTSFRLFEPKDYKLYKANYPSDMEDTKHKVNVAIAIIHQLMHDLYAFPILMDEKLELLTKTANINEYLKSDDIDIQLVGESLTYNIMNELKNKQL